MKHNEFRNLNQHYSYSKQFSIPSLFNFRFHPFSGQYSNWERDSNFIEKIIFIIVILRKLSKFVLHWDYQKRKGFSKRNTKNKVQNAVMMFYFEFNDELFWKIAIQFSWCLLNIKVGVPLVNRTVLMAFEYKLNKLINWVGKSRFVEPTFLGFISWRACLLRLNYLAQKFVNLYQN